MELEEPKISDTSRVGLDEGEAELAERQHSGALWSSGSVWARRPLKGTKDSVSSAWGSTSTSHQ